MQPEHAPPGYWQWPGDRPVLIDGVTLESRVPTRFFQTIDAYPGEWGRLSWRIQLNKIVSGQTALPAFRTFYPGVEWNLKHPDYRWFLTAWLKWEGPGPPYRDPALPGPPQIPALIKDDTVLFCFAWMPKPKPVDVPDVPPEPDFERPLFLRSRVDARDRRSIAEAVHAKPEVAAKPASGVISLDDIIEAAE